LLFNHKQKPDNQLTETIALAKIRIVRIVSVLRVSIETRVGVSMLSTSIDSMIAELALTSFTQDGFPQTLKAATYWPHKELQWGQKEVQTLVTLNGDETNGSEGTHCARTNPCYCSLIPLRREEVLEEKGKKLQVPDQKKERGAISSLSIATSAAHNHFSNPCRFLFHAWSRAAVPRRATRRKEG
jgi:hypothetical protein